MKIDTKAVWQQAKSNSAKLRGCKRHRFPAGPVKLGLMHSCLDCGGLIDGLALHHYIAGYEAAGGDSADIYPGFRAELPR